jgi:tetratricopeptide (TPR) repeat protein
MIALTAAHTFPAVESARMKSYGLKYLGIYGVYTHNYQQAAACFNQGLLLARQIEDRELEAMLVNNLGVVYNMAGNFSQALHCFQQALTISETLGERNSTGLALINLAETYHLLGDWEEAKHHVGQALTLYHEEGYQLYEAKAWARLGRIAHAAGNDIMAHSYLEQAIQIAHSASLDTVQAEFLTDLGHILLSMHQVAEADQVYRQALAGWQQVGARQPAWRVQAGLAQIALLQNRPTTALAHVQAVLANLTGAPINALYEPITVYWLCYQTLSANQDPAALDVLQRGYALLQQFTTQIDDPRLHRSFLENNPVNRTLLLTAQRLSGK